ncbi:MAG: hypothetical protein ABWX84_16600 [Nocardioides sp.]
MGEKPGRTQRWSLTVDGHEHRVEAVERGLTRRVEWWVDEALVATTRTSDEKVTLRPGTGVEPPVEQTGTLQVRFTPLGRGRRATWHEGAVAVPGAGVDLEPEPGSPAAAYEERVRRHPRRHAARAVAVSVLTVVLPLLLGLLAIRFAVSLPWPDLPSIPRPDLPSVPLPDLPLPDIALPAWTLPGWVRRVLDVLGHVWPVLLALALARTEIRRRRRQDELRAVRAGGADDQGDRD